MNRIRERLFWPFIVLILLGCGAFLWRRMHPSLTPQEHITAQTNGLAQAVESRSVRGFADVLAPEFAWESKAGANKKDVVELARAAFFSWRDVHVELSGVQVTVNGDKASSHGNFRALLRPSLDAPTETHSGSFDLEWELHDGQWKVVKARGDGIAGLSGN